MINDMKLGMKIMRYGSGLKSNIVLGALFMVIGLALVILRMAMFRIIGTILIMCASMMPYQVIGSLNVSNMALASPIRKKLQTTIQASISCSCMLIAYLIEDLLILIMACIYPALLMDACKMVVILIALSMFMMIYIPIIDKYTVVALIVFIIVFVISIIYGILSIYEMFGMDFAFFEKGISSFVLISIVGLPVIVLGGFLQYLISLLVYKVPISKFSQYLQKEL